MSQFPVYDIFKNQVHTIALPNDDEKKKLIEDIKSLDKSGKETLYCIIRYSSILDGDKAVYSAKYGRRGVVFDLNEFSDTLLKIVCLFVRKHKQEMESSVAPVEIVFE